MSEISRMTGTVRTWNDERGFGFITPTGGGRNLFVHISNVLPRGFRPAIGDVVSYTVDPVPVDESRRQNALTVRLITAAADRTRTVSRPTRPAPPTISDLLAFATLIIVIAVGVVLWDASAWVIAYYSAMSVLTAIGYAADKRAAQNARWRRTEVSLLFSGLLGGWPGAIIAQRVLRHKTAKRSFRARFWATVVANLMALGYLMSPPGQEWIALVLESIVELTS